jgi:8-oxo-dGTP pyrophosphatase MutT (NUDIX family)
MTVSFSFGGDEPATPRDAATVLVLREAPHKGAPELFFVKRNAGARFMGGAYVFPGGRLDPHDHDPTLPCNLSPTEAARRLGDDDPARALALHVAALRECLEESGILFATEAVSPADAQTLREALAAPDAPTFAALLRARALTLDTQALAPLSRWVTPRVETRRFDARFFVARAPADVVPTHDGSETVASTWLTAAEAIERARRGEIVLAPPTWHTLDTLHRCRDVDAVLACATEAPSPVEPHVVLLDDKPCVVIPPRKDDLQIFSVASKFLYNDGAWIATE